MSAYDPDIQPSSRYLSEEEVNMLRLAATPLVPVERLHLLDFLGYPDPMPSGFEARTRAVVERILELRGAPRLESPLDVALARGNTNG